MVCCKYNFTCPLLCSEIHNWIIYQSKFDTWQYVHMLGIPRLKIAYADTKNLFNEYGKMLTNRMVQSVTGKDMVLYVSSCHCHGLRNSEFLNHLSVTGISLKSAFESWYNHQFLSISGLDTHRFIDNSSHPCVTCCPSSTTSKTH